MPSLHKKRAGKRVPDGWSAIRNLSYRLAAQRMNGGDDGTRNRGLCRDSCVNRSYNKLQDTRGPPKPAPVTTNPSQCWFGCGVKNFDLWLPNLTSSICPKPQQ